LKKIRKHKRKIHFLLRHGKASSLFSPFIAPHSRIIIIYTQELLTLPYLTLPYLTLAAGKQTPESEPVLEDGRKS